MAFQISPGIQVSEINLTAVVPAVATTAGAIAGDFKWGPVESPVLTTSENDVVLQFNEPNPLRATDFFVAKNFLSYGNQLWVSRAVNQDTVTENAAAKNAISASNTSITFIKNEDDYLANHETAGIAGVGPWVAKYPGALGNSLKVSVCPSKIAWQSHLSDTIAAVQGNTTITTTNAKFSQPK